MFGSFVLKQTAATSTTVTVVKTGTVHNASKSLEVKGDGEVHCGGWKPVMCQESAVSTCRCAATPSSLSGLSR